MNEILITDLTNALINKIAFSERMKYPTMDYTVSFNTTFNNNTLSLVLSKFGGNQQMNESHYKVYSGNAWYDLEFKVDTSIDKPFVITSKLSGVTNEDIVVPKTNTKVDEDKTTNNKVEHVITAADLKENPELVDAGVKVGEEVKIDVETIIEEKVAEVAKNETVTDTIIEDKTAKKANNKKITK